MRMDIEITHVSLAIGVGCIRPEMLRWRDRGIAREEYV